jgi:hypothetical protein
MQKLSVSSLDKFSEGCSTFHQESNKIRFAFVWFFHDFLHIFQESANWEHYLRNCFEWKSLESFQIHKYNLVSQVSP